MKNRNVLREERHETKDGYLPYSLRESPTSQQLKLRCCHSEVYSEGESSSPACDDILVALVVNGRYAYQYHI